MGDHGYGTRKLVIALPRPTYGRLVRLAREEDRNPEQQAVWLLRCALPALAHDPAAELDETDEVVSDGPA